MEKIKQVLNEVVKLDNSLFKYGNVKQFTIDMFENIEMSLNDFLDGDIIVSETTLLESFSYELSTAIDICDINIVDFKVLNKLYAIINN